MGMFDDFTLPITNRANFINSTQFFIKEQLKVAINKSVLNSLMVE